MQIRQSSLLRAIGAASAAALGGRAPRKARVLLLTGSDLAARRLDPIGLQPVAISPSADIDLLVSIKSDLVTVATGAASWAVINLLVDAAARVVRLPAPVRAAAIGATVYLADVAVSQAHDQALASKTAQPLR